jgi:tRNA pseudouridine38-40 synthase
VPRYRLLIEYDGAPFVGWQRQSTGLSVQQAIESAFSAFCAGPVDVVAAGRTDAGVHALGQVAHVDLREPMLPERIAGAINAHIRPHPISVLEVRLVPETFHARFAATARHYRYHILDRRAPPTLDFGRVWHIPVRLDTELMHAAAQSLVGYHDFTSFRAAECQAASALKTIRRLHVRRIGDMVEIAASARSFLHHQVRNMVGTLKLVGEGKEPVRYVAEALAARSRAAAGPTAPALGLFLVGVDYPS